LESSIRDQLSVAKEKAILVAALLPGVQINPHDPFDELRALADTAGAVVADELMQKRSKAEPATLIGKGKVEELGEMVQLHNAQVVIFENDLSPSQIGNIEKRIECKVIDRSELILDIFAARARTHEARLQVELAQLEYTYPRLTAMWSHLERITGGAPTGIGTRGPGEQQLEIDRRIVQRKKSQLKREIADVQGRKSREVEARNKDFFTVGLVGYTNAGKSTLFNTVTDGNAYADDKLFATLSTRRWDLGGGDSVMLSDTVGFVRDLPHHLVASFKATLEEAIHSDLLLVVLDIADARSREQRSTVMQVLDEIGANHQPRIIVLNKVDKLEHNADLLVFTSEHPDAITISARSGRNLDQLTDAVRQALRGTQKEMVIDVDLADGRAQQFLETRSNIIDRQYHAKTIAYHVRIGIHQLDRLKSMNTTASSNGTPLRPERNPGWGAT